MGPRECPTAQRFAHQKQLEGRASTHRSHNRGPLSQATGGYKERGGRALLSLDTRTWKRPALAGPLQAVPPGLSGLAVPAWDPSDAERAWPGRARHLRERSAETGLGLGNPGRPAQAGQQARAWRRRACSRLPLRVPARGAPCGCSDPFVTRQVEETEPRCAAGRRRSRGGSVDAGGGSRAAKPRAPARWRPLNHRGTIFSFPRLSQRARGFRDRAKRLRATRVYKERDAPGPSSSARAQSNRRAVRVLSSAIL